MIASSLESEAPPMSPWFYLAWEPGCDLQFSVGCAFPPWNPAAQQHPGTFVAELWRHDVGELFLRHSQHEESYLEINLAPHGAWWACLFHEYRKPVSSPDALSDLKKAVQPEAATQEESWSASLTIPSDFLEQALGLGPGTSWSTRANVCFILGLPGQRHHFSWAQLPHDPPDFHRVADFVPLC